jgi:DHA1 family bicyclomycin/chloramphenicol resistance-like MFS transporter
VAATLLLPETRPPALRTIGGIGAALATYGRLLADRRFLGYVAASSFSAAGMFVYIAGSPHLFIEVHGVPAERFGWLFGANAAGLIGASQVNRLLLNRLSLQRILPIGTALNLAGAWALLAVAVAGVGGLPALLVPLFVTVSSLGIVMPNAAAAALSGDPAHAGSASALIGTAPFVAGALAAAAMAMLHDGSALSMAAVIAGCSTIAFLGHRLLVGRAT